METVIEKSSNMHAFPIPHIYPWLIHVYVWQKPLQYCKVISLQLIKKKLKKKKRNYNTQVG